MSDCKHESLVIDVPQVITWRETQSGVFESTPVSFKCVDCGVSVLVDYNTGKMVAA